MYGAYRVHNTAAEANSWCHTPWGHARSPNWINGVICQQYHVLAWCTMNRSQDLDSSWMRRSRRNLRLFLSRGLLILRGCGKGATTHNCLLHNNLYVPLFPTSSHFYILYFPRWYYSDIASLIWRLWPDLRCQESRSWHVVYVRKVLPRLNIFEWVSYLLLLLPHDLLRGRSFSSKYIKSLILMNTI